MHVLWDAINKLVGYNYSVCLFITPQIFWLASWRVKRFLYLHVCTHWKHMEMFKKKEKKKERVPSAFVLLEGHAHYRGTDEYSTKPRPKEQKSFRNGIFNWPTITITSATCRVFRKAIYFVCGYTSFYITNSQATDVYPWPNRASSVAPFGFRKNGLRILRYLQTAPKLFCRPQTSALPAYSL